MSEHDWPPGEDPAQIGHGGEPPVSSGPDHDELFHEHNTDPGEPTGDHDPDFGPDAGGPGAGEWSADDWAGEQASSESEPDTGTADLVDWADWLHDDEPTDRPNGAADDLTDAVRGWLEPAQAAVAELDWRPDDPWSDMFDGATLDGATLGGAESLPDPVDGLPWSDPTILGDVEIPDVAGAVDDPDPAFVPEDATDAERAVAEWLDAR